MSKLAPDIISTIFRYNVDQPTKEIRKLSKETESLRKANAKYAKDIAQLTQAEGDNSSAIADITSKIRENNKAIAENESKLADWWKQMDLSKKSIKELKDLQTSLKRELKNVVRSEEPERFRQLAQRIDEVSRALYQAEKASKSWWQSFREKSAETVKGFFMEIGRTIMDFTVKAFKSLGNTIMDFSAANSKLAAILGTTKDGISSLTDQAKELGRTTTATASEVTNLQIELAKLGFAQEQIEAMTPAVLKFSKAVDTDLGSAAAFAGAVLRIFHKDASETEDVLSTLAIATTKSSLDFNKLASSMSTIGPIAAAAGLSLEDTTALLGALANAGFDASSAATATRNILLNLCDTNGELARALGQPVKNLDDLVDGLNKLKSEGIDLERVLDLTDKRSAAAFQTILDQADSIVELRDSISGVNEEFQEMADTMADNGKAAKAGFSSAIEGLILQFSWLDDVFAALFKAGTLLLQLVTKAINLFKPLVQILKACYSVIAGIVRPILQLFSAIGKSLAQLKAVQVILKALKAVLTAVVSAWVSYKAALIAATLWTKLTTGAIKAKIVSMWADVKATLAAKSATEAFNAALKKNPIGMVISLLAGLVAGILSFIGVTKKADDAQTRHNKHQAEAMAKYDAEKSKLEELRKVAMDETATKEKRLKAIEKLNKIIPDYNAHLDAETGKYKENKKALDEYLKSLEKKFRLEALKDEYQELIKADQDKRYKLYDKYIEEWRLAEKMEQVDEDEGILERMGAGLKNFGIYHNDLLLQNDPSVAARREELMSQLDPADFEEWYKQQETSEAVALEKFYKIVNGMGYDFVDLFEEVEEEIVPIVDDVFDKAIQRLKDIDKELKELRARDPHTIDELHAIQDRIKALEEEKNKILGNEKLKHRIGEYRQDDLTAVTAPIDDAHQKRLLAINSQKGTLSETEMAIAKNKELIQYCADLNMALENFKYQVDETHTQTIDKIIKEQNKLAAEALAAQQQLDTINNQQLKDLYEKRATAAQAFYDTQELKVKDALAKQEISQEAADLYLMSQQRDLHEKQLKELRDYYENVRDADSMGVEEKQKLLADLEGKIRKAQSQVLTDTGKWSVMMRNVTTNALSPEGIREKYQQQLNDQSQYYATLGEIVAQSGGDRTAVEEAWRRKSSEINHNYQEEIWKLQKELGVTWEQEYNHELELLQYQHEQGIISERQYQSQRVKLQMDTANKYFSYYQGLASNLFTSLQNAEIAASEQKYDVLIRQAENAGEDTTKLEEEKEAEKLKIQKKYADLDFAIKVSEIIGNTAVAIMKAYAQLGPVAGAIAAAVIAATGAAQISIANSERQKIKSMQPSRSSSASSNSSESGSNIRALTGYSDGGYTGDGDRYEVAGVVHRGEYVVPKPIMHDRRVVDAVGMIEAIRRNRIGSGGGRSASFANGGYTSDGAASGTDSAVVVAQTVADLRASIEAIKAIRAFVVLRDLHSAERLEQLGNAPFTRP